LVRRTLSPRIVQLVRFQWWCLSSYFPRLITSWFVKRTPQIRTFGAALTRQIRQMAMFTDSAYAAWQLEKIFSENDLKVLECRFHDAFFPPRSSGDFAKITAWLAFRMFMFGASRIGGSNPSLVRQNIK
jgi:hypothetical protein